MVSMLLESHWVWVMVLNFCWLEPQDAVIERTNLTIGLSKNNSLNFTLNPCSLERARSYASIFLMKWWEAMIYTQHFWRYQNDNVTSLIINCYSNFGWKQRALYEIPSCYSIFPVQWFDGGLMRVDIEFMASGWLYEDPMISPYIYITYIYIYYIYIYIDRLDR